MTTNPNLKQIAEAAIEANEQRRAMVLRYRDVAAKLTGPPLRLKSPDQWTGFVPGPWMPEGNGGSARPNPSPIRAQLMAVLTEAAERADADDAPAVAPFAPGRAA